jgi:hypothetical protein
MQQTDWGMMCKGVELFDKEVKSVENRFQKANVAATKAGANVVKRSAQSRIHSTGKIHDDPLISNLKKHIVVKMYQKRPTNSVALVGPSFPGITAQQRSYYGSWLEEGHRKAKPGKRLSKIRKSPISEKRMGKRWANQYSSGTIGDLAKLELGDGMVEPKPYLRPALDETKSEQLRKMTQVYQKALEKNFKAESMIEELGGNIMDAFSGESEGRDADFND